MSAAEAQMGSEVCLEPSLSSGFLWINFILVSAPYVLARTAIINSRLALFLRLVVQEKRMHLSKVALQKSQGWLSGPDWVTYLFLLNYSGQWDEVLGILWFFIPGPHIHLWNQGLYHPVSIWGCVWVWAWFFWRRRCWAKESSRCPPVELLIKSFFQQTLIDHTYWKYKGEPHTNFLSLGSIKWVRLVFNNCSVWW